MDYQEVVYFVRCGDDGPIKIGYAGDSLVRRLGELQIGCPFELRAIGIITNGSYRLEGELHSLFADLHMRGEWFRPDPALTRFVERRAVRVNIRATVPAPPKRNAGLETPTLAARKVTSRTRRGERIKQELAAKFPSMRELYNQASDE